MKSNKLTCHDILHPSADIIKMIRPKERVLVLLILGTFGFVSFATIWYLPDKQAGGGILTVYC